MSKHNLEEKYIIKFKDSMAYLKNIRANKCTYTLKVEEAKRYNKKKIEKLVGLNNFEVINYEEELYKSKEKKYKIYVGVISNEECNIKKDDLISFLEEYEFATDGNGKFTSYLSLKEQYPDSKLIDEIVRIGEIIYHQNIVIMYEALVEISKDEEFNIKNNNTVVITKDNTNEYNQSKIYLEIMKEKYDYDYDAEKQYQILDETFRDKYITEELYKEYNELYNDEEYEP